MLEKSNLTEVRIMLELVKAKLDKLALLPYVPEAEMRKWEYAEEKLEEFLQKKGVKV